VTVILLQDCCTKIHTNSLYTLCIANCRLYHADYDIFIFIYMCIVISSAVCQVL